MRLASTVFTSPGSLAVAVAGAKTPPVSISIDLMVQVFAPGIVTSEYSDLRLTLSPDGRTLLFSSECRKGAMTRVTAPVLALSTQTPQFG